MEIFVYPIKNNTKNIPNQDHETSLSGHLCMSVLMNDVILLTIKARMLKLSMLILVKNCHARTYDFFPLIVCIDNFYP